jgi:hydrogenase maturation protease
MKDEALVLGIGNILWADEGFGIRAVEALHSKFEMPEGVRVMDGGTQGIFLLPLVRSAKRLLIFDAVDFGDAPATLRLILGDDVPRFMGAKKMSMHQAGFQEVLASAELAGELPAELALIGVQPELLDDYGGSLRPSVKNQIEPAIRLAEQVLERWGFRLQPRTSPPEELVGPSALDIRDYEDGRPVIDGGGS